MHQHALEVVSPRFLRHPSVKRFSLSWRKRTFLTYGDALRKRRPLHYALTQYRPCSKSPRHARASSPTAGMQAILPSDRHMSLTCGTPGHPIKFPLFVSDHAQWLPAPIGDCPVSWRVPFGHLALVLVAFAPEFVCPRIADWPQISVIGDLTVSHTGHGMHPGRIPSAEFRFDRGAASRHVCDLTRLRRSWRIRATNADQILYVFNKWTARGSPVTCRVAAPGSPQSDGIFSNFRGGASNPASPPTFEGEKNNSALLAPGRPWCPVQFDDSQILSTLHFWRDLRVCGGVQHFAPR